MLMRRAAQEVRAARGGGSARGGGKECKEYAKERDALRVYISAPRAPARYAQLMLRS
jgi:hypothetical protein